MHTEIEAKFPNTEHGLIRSLLTDLGAICKQPERLMRRAVYHNKQMSDKDAFFRIRDEGNRVTLTYKQFNEDSLTGAREYEVVVSDFDTAVAAIDATGLVHDTYQESRRETWQLGDVEIVLDEWPWIRPYIEIEGPSESAVHMVANQLGLNWSKAVFGGVANVYLTEYPHIGQEGIEEINHNWPVIKFSMKPPKLLVHPTEG